MFKGKRNVTQRQLVQDELGESFEHAMRAAEHAASGVRASMRPKLAPTAERVRSAATDGWDSLSEAAQTELTRARRQVKKERAKRQGKRQANRLAKPSRAAKGNRWPMAGLLAGGVALGAVAGLVWRRRRQPARWGEYGPTEPTEARRTAEPAAERRGDTATQE